jgi:hypothetical protein
MTHAKFRDEFIAFCDAIGLRTEKQGEKYFVLKPEGLLSPKERAVNRASRRRVEKGYGCARLVVRRA